MMTRCECMDLPFLGLLSYARKHGITNIEDLIKATRCCTGCGTCRPHLEELLKTGKLRVGDRLIELPRIDVPLNLPPPDEARDE